MNTIKRKKEKTILLVNNVGLIMDKFTIKQMMPYTIITCGLFIMALILGYISAIDNPNNAEQLTQEFKTTQADPIAATPVYEQALIIFVNNAGIGLMMIFVGVFFAFIALHLSDPLLSIFLGATVAIFSYALDPSTSTLMDTIGLGIVVTLVLYIFHFFADHFRNILSFGSVILLSYNGYMLGNFSYALIEHSNVFLFLFGTLIHGIFELSAIFLSGGVGLYVSWLIAHRLVKSYKQLFMTTMGFYLFKVVPIFLVAAIIEAFITRAVILALR